MTGRTDTVRRDDTPRGPDTDDDARTIADMATMVRPLFALPPDVDFADVERRLLSLDGIVRYRGRSDRPSGVGDDDAITRARAWARRVVSRVRRGIIAAARVVDRVRAAIRDRTARIERAAARRVADAFGRAARVVRDTADAARATMDAAADAATRPIGAAAVVAVALVALLLLRR